MTDKVQETHDNMQREQAVVEETLQKLLEEKEAIEQENKGLLAEIKNKNDIIKQLTRENLSVNSNLTQMQQLLCA